MNDHPIAARAQRGQALTEMLAVSLVLVPLFLLVPLIAKYQDIAHATEAAARYVAFEAANRAGGSAGFKSPNQLAGEVQRRFFGNADAPIKANDTAGNFKAHQNLFWRDPKDNALIGDINNDVQVSFGEGYAADHAGAYKGASDGQPFLLKDFMGLDAPGIYRANVTVRLVNMPADIIGPTRSYDLFKNINLSMTRHTDLVVDGWAARGPDHTQGRLENVGVYAGNFFDSNPLGEAAVDLVNAAVTIIESPAHLPGACTNCGPKLGKLDYWKDQVPADRLR